MRLYPNNSANTDASAVHNTSTVTADAACGPYSLAIKSAAMNFEFTASRHGTTAMRLSFVSA